MVTILLTAVIAFFFSSLFGHVVHWSLHQTWTGKINQKHMTHHLTLYPPSDYQSAVYRSAGQDNTIITFSIASIPVVAVPVILGLVGWLSWPAVVTALVVMGIMGFLHGYLHDAFHITNHFLTRLPIIRNIFARWVRLHYLHHVDMQRNFGIFLFHWDHIFKTFWEEKFSYLGG